MCVLLFMHHAQRFMHIYSPYRFSTLLVVAVMTFHDSCGRVFLFCFVRLISVIRFVLYDLPSPCVCFYMNDSTTHLRIMLQVRLRSYLSDPCPPVKSIDSACRSTGVECSQRFVEEMSAADTYSTLMCLVGGLLVYKWLIIWHMMPVRQL